MTLFPVFIQKMSKQIIIKYFEKSDFAKEPIPATEESAGHDLYAEESRTILPRSCDTVSLDLRWAIPQGFYDKIYPRSSILKKHLVTVDAGLIDSDFRGIVEVLFINHCEKTFTIRTGDRIAKVVFAEKFNAKFEKVTKKDLLGTTKRGSGGFGSTGMSVIKIAEEDPMNDKEEQKNLVESDDKNILGKVNASLGEKPVLVQIAKEPENDLQIVSEEAIMKVNDKVIVAEKITID